MVERSDKDLIVLESAKTKLNNTIKLVTNLPPFNFSTVLVIGVFHGDEPQGKYLIEKYLSLPPLPNPLPQGAREQISTLNKLKILKYAKDLRKNMTDAEQLLWYILRAKRFLGLKFKRQQPIGKYIVDFVCLKEKIIIELDGGQHNELQNKEQDKERTNYLNSLGYQVIRIWNNEVFENFEGVKEYLYNTLTPFGRELGINAETNSLPPVWGRVRERGHNLLFIPCLNPDGLQNNTRTNANGVDLNRNFPTKNWGEDTSQAGDNPADYFGGKSPASEIETKFVIDVIEKYQPKLILTLHAPYKIVNYDGPAKEIAQKISDIIDYPVEESIGYPTPGSFGTYCGVERNIPTITLELDEKIPVTQLEQPVFEIFDVLQFGI